MLRLIFRSSGTSDSEAIADKVAPERYPAKEMESAQIALTSILKALLGRKLN